jgi:hypothetical protein
MDMATVKTPTKPSTQGGAKWDPDANVQALEAKWWRETPMTAIRMLVMYLEHDERKHYEDYLDDDGKIIEASAKEAKRHIYNHVRRVANWLDSLSADSNRN